jgi:hypothetical protein
MNRWVKYLVAWGLTAAVAAIVATWAINPVRTYPDPQGPELPR